MEEEINSNMNEFFDSEFPLLGRVVIQDAIAVHSNTRPIYLGADLSKPVTNERSKDPSDTSKPSVHSDRTSSRSTSKGESSRTSALRIEKQYQNAKWDLVADTKLKLTRLKRQHAEEKHELECKILKTEHKMRLEKMQEEHNFKMKMLKKKFGDKIKEL